MSDVANIVELKSFDIFKLDANALVNPVNCNGISGAGLALQFKNKFPANYIKYRKTCKSNTISPGTIISCIDTHPYKNINFHIFNFTTKNNYYENSSLEYIEIGMKNLFKLCESENILSIAIPKLGCGLGKLNWANVFPIIFDTFKNSDIVVFLPTR